MNNNILNYLNYAFKQMDLKETIPNKDRMKQFKWAEKRIVECSNDFSGVRIDSVTDDPFPGGSRIELIGKKVVINDPNKFSSILRLADIVDIAPLTDGNVSVSIEYKNTTKPVDRVVR